MAVFDWVCGVCRLRHNTHHIPLWVMVVFGGEEKMQFSAGDLLCCKPNRAHFFGPHLALCATFWSSFGPLRTFWSSPSVPRRFPGLRVGRLYRSAGSFLLAQAPRLRWPEAKVRLPRQASYGHRGRKPPGRDDHSNAGLRQIDPRERQASHRLAFRSARAALQRDGDDPKGLSLARELAPLLWGGKGGSGRSSGERPTGRHSAMRFVQRRRNDDDAALAAKFQLLVPGRLL